MADFAPAFEKTLLAEGGYTLSNHPADRGGQTFAGIARKRWPHWAGWAEVDRGSTPSAELVRSFYRAHFWEPLRLDGLEHQRMAETLYDFGVNAGTGTATKLAQIVVGTTPDGVLGTKTLVALNAHQPDLFLARYALAKLARYEQIVSRDSSQRVFLLGWVRRTLKEAAAT